MLNRKYDLNDGSTLPEIGLGTVNIRGARGVNSIVTAIEENGYRLIDTSTNYNNEGVVGEAIRRADCRANS